MHGLFGIISFINSMRSLRKVKSAAPDAGLILVVPYQPHQAEPGLVGKVDSSETNKCVDCS